MTHHQETRPAKIAGSSEVPAEFRETYLKLVSLTDEFCNDRLDVDYQQLCREMAIAICQPGSPVQRGKPASWACGIVYALGQVNFLGDSSFQPYVRSNEIAEWFGVSMGTMQSKAKVIREGLDLIPFDPEFTVPSMLDQNPLVWMIEVNGFIVDIRHAPREMQEAAYKAGLIPYVPSDRETPGEGDADDDSQRD